MTDRSRYTTVTINFDKDDLLIDWLDSYAKECGMTKSKLLRRLVKKEKIRADRGE